ncbi:MAG: hypothetical protein QM492_03280 [Rhodobacterales bacterium]
MQWIVENWVLVALGGGMIAMHLFGHRGHGSKGGGGCCGGKTKPKQKDFSGQNDAPSNDEQQDAT